MGKLKSKVLYLMIGVLVGISYVVACGGSSSSGAASIGNAIDVIYDNVTSALTATNVQAAIDEVVTRIQALETSVESLEDAISADSVVGAWTGKLYNETSSYDVTLTLNADGTYSCTGNQSPFLGMCALPVGWSIVGKNLLIQNGGATPYELFIIQIVNSSTLSLLNNGERLAHLTK